MLKHSLEDVLLHVDSNGAHQFGKKGLVRVLIPSRRQKEVRFVPKQTGTFEYRCDLLGHQMVEQS